MPTGKVAIGENYELDYDSHLDGAEIVSFAPNRTEIIAFVRNLNPDWPSDGKEIREVRRFHNPGSGFVGRIQWLQGELISDYQLNSPFRSFFWICLALSLLGGITIAAFAKHRFSIILSAVLLCGSIFILVIRYMRASLFHSTSYTSPHYQVGSTSETKLLRILRCLREAGCSLCY